MDPETKDEHGWQRGPNGSKASIDALVRTWPNLPRPYVNYLERGAGEGELGVEPGWAQVWPAEKVIELNELYRVADNLPDFVAFGGSGGGELLVFDQRSWHVYMIPFIPMAADDAVEIASDFAALADQFGRRAPAV